MKRLFALVLVALLTTGCGAVGAAIGMLATVTAVIAEAGHVLNTVDALTHRYLAQHPDPVLAQQYAAAYAKTELALGAALRIAKGAEKLDQQKVDEALAEFRVAYQQLLALLGPYGIVASSQDGTYGVTPNGTPMVPHPMAMQLRVE